MDKERDDITWICGRYNGTEEEAVRVVELVSQLTQDLHQFHHTIHEVSFK